MVLPPFFLDNRPLKNSDAQTRSREPVCKSERNWSRKLLKRTLASEFFSLKGNSVLITSFRSLPCTKATQKIRIIFKRRISISLKQVHILKLTPTETAKLDRVITEREIRTKLPHSRVLSKSYRHQELKNNTEGSTASPMENPSRTEELKGPTAPSFQFF